MSFKKLHLKKKNVFTDTAKDLKIQSSYIFNWAQIHQVPL